MDSSDIKRSLKKKGFEEDKGDHHVYRYPGTSVNTKISHGPKETLGPVLEKKMAVQIHLTTKDFRDFVSCTFSKEQYRALLIAKQILPPA